MEIVILILSHRRKRRRKKYVTPCVVMISCMKGGKYLLVTHIHTDRQYTSTLREITCELFIFLNDVRRFRVCVCTREILLEGVWEINRRLSRFSLLFIIIMKYTLNVHLTESRKPINITFYAHFYSIFSF